MTTLLARGPTKPKTPTTKAKAKAYQSVNPYDGKTFKTFEELTEAKLETAIKTAATCFETWRHKTFADRAIIVTKAATIMRERADEFAKPVTLEMGKLIAESRGEVALSADILQFAHGTDWRIVAPPRGAHDLPLSQVRRGRRPHELRSR
jgi:acyl-CoA reductase-like NAD-dependent aldehyde dehydrogenase